MILQKERELVVAYGRKISAEKLSTDTSGNISIYNIEKGLMAITPSGMAYDKLTPEDIVVMDLDSHVIEGSRKPSSEWDLHSEFYKHKPSITAVVHTHPEYCTIFSVLHEPLKPIHFVIAEAGAREIPCAPYALFGTRELAESAVAACGESKAVLLANHGLITCGETIEAAYDLSGSMEYLASLQYRSRCIGTPVELTDAQMDDVMRAFGHYGQKRKDDK